MRPAALPLALFALLAPAIAGCTRVPELETQVPPGLHDAPYPPLIPLDVALAQTPPAQGEAETLEAQLEGRRRGLNARARALLSPVLTAEEEARLRERIEVPPED